MKRLLVVRKTAGVTSQRSLTMSYFLCVEKSESVSVCKLFHLTTLGFAKNNDVTVMKALHSVDSGSAVPKRDGRGSGMHKAFDRSAMCSHVESFGPSISHYRREHASNRRHLPSDISVCFMHKDFSYKKP